MAQGGLREWFEEVLQRLSLCSYGSKDAHVCLESSNSCGKVIGTWRLPRHLNRLLLIQSSMDRAHRRCLHNAPDQWFLDAGNSNFIVL